MLRETADEAIADYNKSSSEKCLTNPYFTLKTLRSQMFFSELCAYG